MMTWSDYTRAQLLGPAARAKLPAQTRTVCPAASAPARRIVRTWLFRETLQMYHLPKAGWTSSRRMMITSSIHKGLLYLKRNVIWKFLRIKLCKTSSYSTKSTVHLRFISVLCVSYFSTYITKLVHLIVWKAWTNLGMGCIRHEIQVSSKIRKKGIFRNFGFSTLLYFVRND